MNPYIYNPQIAIDRINSKMADLERQKAELQQIPMQQPTNLTQNFQLAPTTRDVVKYADSIDEVQKDMVIGDTPYFSKDMSVVWIKNIKGEIKTYELNEIIEQDEKDLQIELLQAQLEEIRKEVKKYEQYATNVTSTEDTTNTTGNDDKNGTTTKENKSTGVQKLSTSKE